MIYTDLINNIEYKKEIQKKINRHKNVEFIKALVGAITLTFGIIALYFIGFIFL